MSDLTGTSRTIYRRISSSGGSTASSGSSVGPPRRRGAQLPKVDDRHETHGGAYDVFGPNEYEPPDTNLSAPLTAEDFEDFLGKHELTVVNFGRGASGAALSRLSGDRSEDTGAAIHGHAHLAQVDCVANQAFC